MHISYRTFLTILAVSTCNLSTHPISRMALSRTAYRALQTTAATATLGLVGAGIAELTNHCANPSGTPPSPYYVDLLKQAEQQVGNPPSQHVFGNILKGIKPTGGFYSHATDSIYLNEKYLNISPYGMRRLLCLHEATHRAQFLRPGYAYNYDPVACEREADENALTLAQCHRCVREYSWICWYTKKSRGYVSKADCREYEDRYIREGKICHYHAKEHVLARIMSLPVFGLGAAVVYTTRGNQFLAQTLYQNTIPPLAEHDTSLDLASGDLTKRQAFFPASA